MLKLNVLANDSKFLAHNKVSILCYKTKESLGTYLCSSVPVEFSIDKKEVNYSMNRSTLISFLSNGTLLISCKLKISTNEKVVNQPITANNYENVDTVERHLKDDYADLLESGKFSDVTITVKTKSFKAIKGILAACSPVFSAMFNYNELKENAENEVIIEDIDEDVVRKLLYYMYTGEVNNIQEMPMDLFDFFVLADKYNSENLKHGALAFLLA